MIIDMIGVEFAYLKVVSRVNILYLKHIFFSNTKY